MHNINLNNVLSTVKTPIASFDNLVTVGDARICDDRMIQIIENGGIRTETFKNNSSSASVKVKCISAKPLTLRIGYVNKEGKECFDGIHATTIIPEADGVIDFEKTFDASNLIVYYDAIAFFVQIDSEERNQFKIEEGLIWQRNEMELLDIYADNLEKIICKIDKKFHEIAFDTDNNKESIVVSPNGKKFIINTNEEGILYTTPLIPNKVLFVGNSILLGMGNYGMCASSPRNDFYYYVTEAIKCKNPNAVFCKAHGARYELLEDATHFDELWYEDHNPYTKRPISESFTEDLDLIIIQLGTNVNNDKRKNTLNLTIDTFISRIKQSSPKARIVWIHGWSNEHISGEIIKKACNRWRIGQICIKDIHVKKYCGELMQRYEKSDGEIGIVDEYWIDHPGNEGMKKIAERIIDYLKL